MLMVAMTALVGMSVQLQDHGPSISPAMATVMKPQALGDLVLAPGHPPVIDATVGPQGMEPPPPPNTPIATKIVLYLQPTVSTQAGFCERMIATVHLKPVDRRPDDAIPASPADSLSVEAAYHWIGDEQKSGSCPVERYAFFVPRPDELAATLERVRMLASAQRLAKRGGRLPFALSVNDVEGPVQLAFDRTHPELGPTPNWKVFKNPRAALIALPVGLITYVGPLGAASSDNLFPPEFRDHLEEAASGYDVFMGGDWTAGVVERDGRIMLIRMRRAVPPPF